ncbi:hypothetical protein CUMW_218410 [Citrus unshiu]|uniref:PDZ domain-containing protein n=1 Tax=Citrus unshiu TaxID=55188 RepID=A0A2H5QE57_CITUN|nr:hypothetical protein CUMW_218410 [Citrus unshiu]
MIVCRSYMCTFSLSCSANNRLPPPLITICYLPLIRSRAKATTICAANYSSSGSKALVLTKQSSSFSLEPFSLRFASSVDSAKISFLVSSVSMNPFTLDELEFPQGDGSGFLWDEHGHIVTNYHVIQGASNVKVTLFDRSTFQAKVVGHDQDQDLAVLRINAQSHKLRSIPVGVSANLRTGEKVYAIGHPVSMILIGIALGREVTAATGRSIQGLIQIDAAINPGNSGGPLLDSSGALIGVNTFIIPTNTGVFCGIAFSIPIDTVSSIVDQLVKFGKIIRPYLGIKYVENQLLENHLGVSGVLFLASENGPAGKAGLRSTTFGVDGKLILGDIIKSMNGKNISNANDLYKILDQCKTGDEVSCDA